MLAMWLLSSVVLINSYTSNLMASMTIPGINMPIESLRELANQDEVQWSYRDNTAYLSLFEVNYSTIFKHV